MSAEGYEAEIHQRGERETSQHKQVYIDRIKDLTEEIGRHVVPPKTLGDAKRVVSKLDRIK